MVLASTLHKKDSLSIRPGNRATLGLLRTYFYYCRIVGLVPIIPYPQKSNWIGAQRTQRSLFAQPSVWGVHTALPLSLGNIKIIKLATLIRVISDSL